MDEERIMDALGWTVVEADGMSDDGCVVASQHVALVRAGLHPDVRHAVVGRMLTMALSHESSARPGH